MADSPLADYTKLAKEVGIDEAIEMPTEFKLAFVKEQIDQIKTIIWRNCVDYVVSVKNAEDESNPDVESKHRQKADEYRATVRQMSKSLKTFIKLRDELEG